MVVNRVHNHYGRSADALPAVAASLPVDVDRRRCRPAHGCAAANTIHEADELAVLAFLATSWTEAPAERASFAPATGELDAVNHGTNRCCAGQVVAGLDVSWWDRLDDVALSELVR